MKKYIVGFIFLSLHFACSDEIITEDSLMIEESDLIGGWRSEATYVNDLPASDFINGDTFYESILGIREDDFYFYNYSSGDWSLNENELYLSNLGTFKITEFTDSTFTMEGKILAGQSYWKFNGITNDETIVFKEKYRRE